MKDCPIEVCPIYHRAVEIIGRRWAGAILQVMLEGASRFSEMEDAIPEISGRMLCQRLRELEEEGIVERHVIPETPVRVEYRLSEKGRALGPVLRQLSEWANEWIEPCQEHAGSIRKPAPAQGSETGS